MHQPALASATARYQSGHFRGRPAGAVRRGDGEPVRLGADKDHIGEREEIRGPFQQLVAKLAARDLRPSDPTVHAPPAVSTELPSVHFPARFTLASLWAKTGLVRGG